MAHVRFNGYREFVSDEVLPVKEEQWGLHGPAHTRWVETHVYWVLPFGTMLLVTLTFLVFFWGFGGSFRSQPQPSPMPMPAVSTPPAPAPAAPPQVTVNIPDHIQVEATVQATVQDVSTPPSVPVPNRELTPEEKAEKLKEELRRQYGVQ